MRKIKKIGDVETFPVDVIINKPVRENTRVLFSHIARYVIACRKLDINDRNVVVDASCGEGYGTYYLSTKAEKVYGLDIYETNLKYARKYFDVDNVRFLKYFDFLKTKISRVDKLVCIETLEHISKKNMEEYIKLLMRILKVRGDMFLTIPLGENEPSVYNKFHKNEPSIDVIYKIFMPRFEKIDIEISSFINSYGEETEYAMFSMYNKRN